MGPGPSIKEEDMPELIVLRNLNAISTAGPFDMVAGAFSFDSVAPPLAQVETHDVPLSEAVSLSRDPTVAAVAVPMEVSLIEPLADEDVPGAAAAVPAWGISAVGADTSSSTGAGVTVAVLDTGIDRTHPAFAGMTIVEQDFTGSGNGDVKGHGTHCAGTIFGRDVAGTRVGVARGVQKALIGKVLGNTGGGDSSMIFRGIQWAADQKAHVISMSLGFDFPAAVERMQAGGLPLPAAVSRALEAYRSNLRFFDRLMQMIAAGADFGVTPVVVAAAGNESQAPAFTISASLPSAAEHVISVAALQQAAGGLLDIAPFSNVSAQIGAPGVGIVSAKTGGGLTPMNGTSMACPHVAGVAALWWQKLQSQGLASASRVSDNLIARATQAGLAPGAGPLQRGAGLVTSPA